MVSLGAALHSIAQQPAQTRSELERQRAEIQRQIDDVKQTLEETKRNRKETLGQLSLLQRKLRLREAAIQNINAQVNLIQNDMNESWREILKLRRELDTLKIQYAESVVYAYKNRSNYDFLNFIFSATNFNDAVKRVAYLRSYRAYREERAQNIATTQSLLQSKIDGLRVKRQEKDVVLKKQNKEREVLEDEKKEKDQFVSQLKSRERELQKQLAIKKRQDEKMLAAISAAIRRETAKAAAEERKRESDAKSAPVAKSTSAAPVLTTKTESNRPSNRPGDILTSTPEGLVIAESFKKNKGRLPWPVDAGHVSLPFGPYEIPEIHVKSNNPGITIETKVGMPVKAIFEGEVTSIFNIEGTTVVMVRHGDFFSSYTNLSSVSVSKGDKIKTGQVLGKAAENNDGNGETMLLIMNADKENLNPEQWLMRK